MKRSIPMLCTVFFLFTAAADCEAARLGGRTTIRPSRPAAVPQRTYPGPTYRPSSPAVRNLNNTQSGSAVPMPIFIPPVIGQQNLIKIFDGFYVIKTGIRRKGDEVYFWTMQNHGFIPDSKSSKIQYVIVLRRTSMRLWRSRPTLKRTEKAQKLNSSSLIAR